MSLATRCTACGTIFRIVEDQLRVSDGWVRCGRCAEVFDARELLFDIERDTPPAWPPVFPGAPAPAPGTAPTTAVEVLPPPPPAPLPPPPPPPALPEPVWVPPPEPEPEREREPRPATLPAGWPTDEATRMEPQWGEIDLPVEAPPPPPQAARPREPAAPPKAAQRGAPSPAVVPEFMRHAESTARWNRPIVRIALALLSLLLAAALALQVALHFRDALAALHPPLRPGLVALCEPVGCDIQPWRRIEALSIESTSLNPVGSGYRLNLSLRNKTGVAVAAPWVELSLTDASGSPFARRVVAPDALTPAIRQIGPDAEQSLSLSFATGGQRVSGYNVNIFHP
ncbi:zinc-ribbon and DUF3426 domain-containing protein [Roseateles sp. BYS96W]|uniref:Zinc-ribbon and DUF3426 domain-containing protein n=1 Tax=Pelomonas nitida TaxID=3299027 RepID=A0ABW7GCI2_9BURK